VGYTVGHISTTATVNSNINGATNACATRDNSNIIDFGNLSGGVLALNCTWHQWALLSPYDDIIQSDTRFDNSARSWVSTTVGCSGARYDLLSVATHEMGHWVGLGHVVEAGGNDLTMSPNTASCNASAQTLGKGDVIALNIPY
jgi:hypothetical protein